MPTHLEKFKHQTPIQVRFNDFDMMGHVNNANYFSYAETARLKYYDDVIGIDTDWHKQHGLIMARFEIDYKKAISYDDTVSVFTRCSKLGNKSFDMSWIIASNDGAELFAEGKTIIVCYDYGDKKTKEIPADRRRQISEFESMPLS